MKYRIKIQYRPIVFKAEDGTEMETRQQKTLHEVDDTKETVTMWDLFQAAERTIYQSCEKQRTRMQYVDIVANDGSSEYWASVATIYVSTFAEVAGVTKK